MAYCTQADIELAISDDVLTQLTDDDNAGSADAEVVAQAIATADAEIDGYCAAKYAVPFATVPAIVKALSIEISVYYLYKRRSVPEKIEKAYEKAIARLKDISRGLLTLGVDPPPAASTSADSAECNKTASDRIFTMDKMRGF
jgi:phage gp36-like protein